MNAPFLTDVDSRAAIKGSREPLGLQSIWTRLGRQVVFNLTTVTRSVRDFTAMLLGFHLLERRREQDAGGSDLDAFLRWEQLAAYSRALGNNDFGFRGTERVRSRVQGGERLVLSAETAHQILSNQKIYGLWGLFTNASRDSGLIAVDPLRPAPAGIRLLEEAILPALARGGLRDASSLVELLGRRALVDVDTGAGLTSGARRTASRCFIVIGVGGSDRFGRASGTAICSDENQGHGNKRRIMVLPRERLADNRTAPHLRLTFSVGGFP